MENKLVSVKIEDLGQAFQQSWKKATMEYYELIWEMPDHLRPSKHSIKKYWENKHHCQITIDSNQGQFCAVTFQNEQQHLMFMLTWS